MRRLLVAGVLLGLCVGYAQAQQPAPTPSPGGGAGAGLVLTPGGDAGARLVLTLSEEQTKLIVDLLGQAQCGALSVSTLALCQNMTALLEEIRRQAREQHK